MMRSSMSMGAFREFVILMQNGKRVDMCRCGNDQRLPMAMRLRYFPPVAGG